MISTPNCFGLDLSSSPTNEGTNMDSNLKIQIPKSYGYRFTLPLPSISSSLTQTAENSFVYIVKILRITNLNSCYQYYNSSNPFVEMKYISNSTSTPPTTTAAATSSSTPTTTSTDIPENQRTSYKPLTTHPEWMPPERFMFLSDHQPTKNSQDSLNQIQFTVYSLPGLYDKPNLGTMTLSLDGISDTETEYTLPLYHADDGSLNGAEIKVSLQRMTYQMATSYQEILVYEYERWQPILDWGNSYPGHLLPIDPGRWSNIWGSQFEMELTKILDPLPDQWSSINAFHVQPSSKDERGWEYAFDFSSSDWYPQSSSNSFVRRRIWKKEICNCRVFPATPLPNTRTTPSPVLNRRRSNSSTMSSPKAIPLTSPKPNPRPRPSQSIFKASSTDSDSSFSSLPSSSPSNHSLLTVQLLSSKMLTTKFYFFGFDFENFQQNVTFTLAVAIPLSYLPLHSEFTQIINRLGVQVVHGNHSFTRNMTQLIRSQGVIPPSSSSTTSDQTSLTSNSAKSSASPPSSQQLADDAYVLHFAGNILIGLESCIAKEDTESFCDIQREILPSKFGSIDSQDTEIESTVTFDQCICAERDSSISSLKSVDKVLQYRPVASDVIPIFLLPVDHHSYDESAPSNQLRVENICLKYGIRYQEWHESIHGGSSGTGGTAGAGGGGKMKTTKNIWKLIYNEDISRTKQDRSLSNSAGSTAPPPPLPASASTSSLSSSSSIFPLNYPSSSSLTTTTTTSTTTEEAAANFDRNPLRYKYDHLFDCVKEIMR